jgi:MoxR-like ATPase
MESITLDSGKKVLVSDPYNPNPAMLSPFKGREAQLRTIFASWMASESHAPLCPLMVGEPGVGKNRIVYELSHLTALPLYMIQGHEDITAEDLACTVRFKDGERDKMDYVLSPLATAMHQGGICFIDEIGKIRPRALALLVSVLDERRYIDSTLLAERIPAHAAFRFVAATNSGEDHELPEFIRSRLKPVVQVGFPSDKEIADIVSTQVVVAGRRKALLKVFEQLWQGRRARPTPRDIIQLFALAESLSSYRAARAVRRPALPHEQMLHATLGSIEEQDLKDAFGELFAEG